MKYSISVRGAWRGRITYFTITVLYICSTFIRENSKVLLLILRSFEGIIVYLAYIMVRLMKIKSMDPVTLQFLFMPAVNVDLYNGNFDI